jgi:hypothetical protein
MEIGHMTKMHFAAVAAAFGMLGGLAFSPPANAIGCFSGGAAGAVAGHMAHHGVLGAIGGCVAGHEAHKYEKRREAQRSETQYTQPTNQDVGPNGTAR